MDAERCNNGHPSAFCSYSRAPKTIILKRRRSGENSPFLWLGRAVVWTYHANFHEVVTSQSSMELHVLSNQVVLQLTETTRLCQNGSTTMRPPAPEGFALGAGPQTRPIVDGHCSRAQLDDIQDTTKSKPSRRAVHVDVLACICVPRPLCNVNCYALRWKQTSEWECRERHVLGCSSCLSVIVQVQLGCIYCCHSSVRPSRNCFSCVCKTRLTEVARDQPCRRPGSV